MGPPVAPAQIPRSESESAGGSGPPPAPPRAPAATGKVARGRHLRPLQMRQSHLARTPRVPPAGPTHLAVASGDEGPGPGRGHRAVGWAGGSVPSPPAPGAAAEGPRPRPLPCRRRQRPPAGGVRPVADRSGRSGSTPRLGWRPGASHPFGPTKAPAFARRAI
jgi:hypothetical protein